MTEEELDKLEHDLDMVGPSMADPWQLVAEIRRLRTENEQLRQQIAGHYDRIAAQSELLSKRAEKP